MKLFIEFVMSFTASLGFAIVFRVPKRHLFLAGIGGLLSWIIYRGIEPLLTGIFIPTLIASAFSSFYAECMARFKKAPAPIYTIPAVVPLIPGSCLYYTLSSVVQSDWEMTRYHGYRTLFYALGIAAGVSLVWAFYQMYAKYQALKNTEQSE